MKNYYDELEVSKTASKEVIGKVYKILAKKYHPDTTKEVDKQAAEEKFKKISEAYEVLSDDEKRKKYDIELEQSNPTISYQDYINVVNQRDYLNNSLIGLQNELNQLKNFYNNNAQYNRSSQPQYQQNQYNQTQFSQNQYTQANSNSGRNYQQQNADQNPNFKKKTYYYTATGKPASAFAYFKYRMKKFFSDIIFYILLAILFITLISHVISFSLNSLFFK